VILHYAIFQFEHAKAPSEAVDLALMTRADAEIDLAELTVAEQSEALEILLAMRANLATWFDEEHAAN
jgi:hypothetical protein